MMNLCDLCGELHDDNDPGLSPEDQETLDYALDSGMLLSTFDTSPWVVLRYQISQWRLREPIFMMQPEENGGYLVLFKPEADTHRMPSHIISQIAVTLRRDAVTWEPLGPGIAVQLSPDAPVLELLDEISELLGQRSEEP